MQLCWPMLPKAVFILFPNFYQYALKIRNSTISFSLVFRLYWWHAAHCDFRHNSNNKTFLWAINENFFNLSIVLVRLTRAWHLHRSSLFAKRAINCPTLVSKDLLELNPLFEASRACCKKYKLRLICSRVWQLLILIVKPQQPWHKNKKVRRRHGLKVVRKTPK